MNTAITVAGVTPCSTAAPMVSTAKPAMNTSAIASTVALMGPPRGPGRRSCELGRGRPGLRRASFRDRADHRQAEQEAADVGEVGDAFAAQRVGRAGEPEQELLEEPEPEQGHRGQLDDGE